MKDSTLEYLGYRVCIDNLSSPAKVSLSKKFAWMSDRFYRDTNKWLADMFGCHNDTNAIVDIKTRTLFVSASVYIRLRAEYLANGGKITQAAHGEIMQDTPALKVVADDLNSNFIGRAK